ncbi:MAG: nucleotidyltransferase family protein [Anaerolineae bacterium]|nr:nucleotidyltransferase family protein [Anaerolineae bacterium]
MIPTQLRTALQGETLDSAEWETAAAAAQQTLLSSLLYSRLPDTDAVPDAVRRQLRQAYAATGLRNTLLLQALDNVLQALHHAGMCAIVLKGAALAQTVYTDVAQRPMRDVDIQVSRADWPRIPSVLHGLGWELAEPLLLDDATGLVTHAVWWCKHESIPLNLEIHSRWLQSPRYDAHPPFDQLWQRAPALPDRPHWRVLACDDQLLHLCVHAFHHHDGNWPLAEVDLVQLLTQHRDDISWARVLHSAETHHFVAALQALLPRLAADWHVPIPQNVLLQLTQLPIGRMEHTSIRCRRSDVMRNLCLLRNLPLRLALRYIAHLVVPPAPYMAAHWRYQSGQSLWWAYVQRWGSIGQSLIHH